MLSTQAEARRFKIDRAPGAFNAELLLLIDDLVSQFEDGVGLVKFKGEDERGRECLVNLYVSESSSYLTLSRKKKAFYDEFYLDHPHISFTDRLFQFKVENEEHTLIQVDEKNGGFSLSRNDKELTVVRRYDRKKSISCKILVDNARYYEGQTE